MDAQQLAAFADTAQRFAQREIVPMVGAETRDGDLGALPTLMHKADEAGLLACADPNAAGYEFGVWGRAALSEGPAASLVVLRQLAQACAGVAACLHFAGLGALETADTDAPDGPAAVAFFERDWRLTRNALVKPPALAARLEKADGAFSITGSKSFVALPPECATFCVWAATDTGWSRLFIPRQAKGLVVVDHGRRIGLAALELVELVFDHAPIEPTVVVADCDPSGFVRRLMLGLAAIALGNAQGALAAARNYAAERYQGGTMISQHPAIRILLGDATTRVEAGAAHLESVALHDGDRGALGRALGAKLRVTLDCAQAVTDCLQVLGGYGYMEDYRLEKRLRDALTLKAMAVRPDDLRMLCATGDEEGAS